MAEQFERDGEVFYTYRGAARRVRRSVRQVKAWAAKWKAQGIEPVYDDLGRRAIPESLLLQELRSRLAAWPIHQQRLARRRLDTPEDQC